MPKFNKRRVPGLSLIEIVIALALLAAITAGVGGLFPQGLVSGKRAQELTVAINLAQAKMESVLAQDYDAIAAGTLEARGRVVSDPQSPFYRFERVTVVSYLSANLEESAADQGLKKIVVTVFPPARLNAAPFTLSTLIAKK